MGNSNEEVLPEKEPQQPVFSMPPIPIVSHFMLDAADIDPDAIADRAEKMANVEKRLRQIALKVTNKSDWVDEGGKPYLQWSGAARIASTFGVSYVNLSTTVQKYTDDKGEYVIFECKGTILWKGRQIEEIGTGSTRDSFFGKRAGQWLPLSEVDLPNVRKKAQTNFLNRGLKSIAGLSFTWEEVTEATGLKPENVGGKVDFKKKEKNLENPKRKELKDMLIKMHGKSAVITLQALTTFKTKDGKVVQGKTKMDECSDAQITRMYPVVKKQYDAWITEKGDATPEPIDFGSFELLEDPGQEQ